MIYKAALNSGALPFSFWLGPSKIQDDKFREGAEISLALPALAQVFLRPLGASDHPMHPPNSLRGAGEGLGQHSEPQLRVSTGRQNRGGMQPSYLGLQCRFLWPSFAWPLPIAELGGRAP